MLDDSDARVAYPLDWAEQDLMLSELTPLLKDMAEFGVNSGLRDQGICGLKWSWEQRVPELDSNGFKRTVFVLPRRNNQKSKQPAVVILNDVAQAIVDKYRGQNPIYVFTWVDLEGQRKRIGRMRNTGWVGARRRAAKRYLEVIGEPAPKGFRNLRVHDLKHTYGKRLRAAGVSKEDRKDLLGHKQKDVTTDYSAPELMRLLEATNKVVRASSESRKTPALTILRLVA
jgi:integrase